MKKTLTISFLLLVFAEFIYNISAYIIKFGLGHMLGPAEYGRYSIVIAFTTMLIILVGKGFPTAMSKRISEQKKDWNIILSIKHAAAKIQTIIIAILTLSLFFLAPVIANLFGDPSLTPLFRLSSFLIPTFALSSFHVAYFNGIKAFGAMTVMKISRGIFRAALILLGAYLYAVHGAILGAIIAPLAVYVVAIIIDTYFIKKPKDVSLSSYPWKKLASFAKVFMAFLFFYELYVRIDIYLIKGLLGDDALTGLYDAAMTITLIPYYAVFALTFILFPTMSKLVADDHTKEIQKLLTRVLVLLVSILSLSVIVLYYFAEPITNLFFGSSFAEAAAYIPLMLGGAFFGTIFYVLASVFNGAGYTRIPVTIVAIALGTSIILNFIYIPQYGPTASAIIFSVTSTFMGVAALLMIHRKFYQ